MLLPFVQEDHSGLIVTDESQFESDIHQCVPMIPHFLLAILLQLIYGFRIQPLQLDRGTLPNSDILHPIREQNTRRSVLRQVESRRPVGLVGSIDAKQVTVNDKRIHPFTLRGQSRNHGLFLGRQVIEIELVPVGTSHHGDMRSEFEGLGTSCLIVGGGRDVTAKGRRRVNQAGAKLNKQPVQSVCVIRRPMLRPIVEQTGVKSTTPRGTSFPQDVGEARRQGFKNPVETEHVGMSGGRGGKFVNPTVIVPFDVRNSGVAQDLRDAVNEVVLDLCLGEIED